MPVVSVTPDYTGEFASDDAVYPVDQAQFSRRYDVTFSDTPSEAGFRTALALNDSRIPRTWEALPGLPWMFVRHRHCEPGNGPFHLVAVIDYETIDDPINQDRVYEWLHAVSSEPIDTASDGSPVLNSSDEAYDPPVSNDVYDQVLRVTRNTESFDEIFASNFIGSVNDDTFFSSPPGTVKMKIFDGRQSRAADLVYWIETLEFEFRVDGWDRRIRDEGFRTVTGVAADGTTEYEILKDKDSNPLSQPALLDGNGSKLLAGEVPVFRSFQLDPRKTFSQLGV